MAKAEEVDSQLVTQQILDILRRIRNIQVDRTKDVDAKPPTLQSSLQQLSHVSKLLTSHHAREAETLATVLSLATQTPEFGGLGLREDQELSPDEEAQVLFLVSAWLESLNSEDRAKSPPKLLASRPEGRRGMTLSEKIFAAHDIERRGELKPGDMVRVDVDWIMASELSWGAMKKQYDALGKPGIFRNDRFWLAGDHVVDPRVKNVPLIKQLVADSEAAKTDFMMTEYQGMNYTIMHTEFFRERAQPGMLVIGSDSHTCSSGSLGCLAIGLGVADVTVPLITGETWFKVPESVNIRLVGKPSPGIGGKDTILYILKELKRNTVAAERIVEFTGPGLQYLSCDARFAIANMTAQNPEQEFGGITGIFTPDQTTHDFITQRKSPRNKRNSKYFRPDQDAVYAATHTIDLSAVQSFIARYPSPDDVVPIRELQGTHLDGCFIGACTTAAEDLILAAMVLELGLQRGLRPSGAGKRKVVPGSLPILHRLQELGFDKVYEDAGFEVGVPGCSYCVGMSADKAAKGEVWLSSQNRNFENRMGTGMYAPYLQLPSLIN
ncbi:putative aconitate hydratase [Lachnellula willkommii]|uniref:Putative aconitate hydratase n=1 Tax=Lachnellula willkommii TaxID=215461 RepID=A0A559M1B1_9HELO|nr:putative aconitate hydratase [Lachnellula willkommii]